MVPNEDKQTKIGSGHAAAMARLGLKELRAAVFPDSNVAQPSEYGLYGTLTPGEVAESRRADELNEEPRTPIPEETARAPQVSDGRDDEREIGRD
jgi:hypothetical protein